MKRLITLFSAIILMEAGCGKPITIDTINWSKSEQIAQSSDSLSSSFSLYKWNKSLMALGGDARTFAVHFLQDDGRNWNRLPTTDPGWIPMDCDSSNNRFIVARGVIAGDEIEVNFLIASLTQDGSFVLRTNTSWKGNKTILFGKTDPNVMLLKGARPVYPLFTGSTFDDSVIYVPYCIQGETYRDRALITAEGPFDNGVFYSPNAGQTWQIEHISSFSSFLPSVCKTKEFYYYFAANFDKNELWCSHKPLDKNTWRAPESVNKTFATSGGNLTYHVVAEGDTVHACWLDRRHEMTRVSLVHPRSENYEVAYCHRKDSDSTWSKDVILSEGLLYAYSPSISVEGDKVVVAWAGVKSDKDGRNEWNPSDIYYVTSKDGGKTWTKPMQVTDGFKEGITSGRPQVALHNGIIHLFYIQGKLNYQEVSAGMAKLNQPPWPIYYTQRPFPD